MASSLTTFTDEARIALDTLSGRATGLFSPSLRLGVTGLSRAGKTVFISAFVHNLIHGGRLPLFEAQKSGRIARAFLEQQPDDAVPRFQYEDHIAALVNDRAWPDSTRAISELRLTIEYESASGWSRMFSSGKLSVDIVDYPGEWLLDLPLLGKSFADFSREALELAALPVREDLSRAWRAISAEIDPNADADEMTARRLAESFAAYLKACKLDERALRGLRRGSGFGRGAHAACPGSSDRSPLRKHAASWPGAPMGSRLGIALAQDSTANRQRGRNEQPRPSRVKSGGWPSIGSRRAWRGRSSRGTDFNSAIV